jgi:hypothetical protein
MERAPRIAARMHEMVKQRLGGEVITAHGDIVIEELEEGEAAL